MSERCCESLSVQCFELCACHFANMVWVRPLSKVAWTSTNPLDQVQFPIFSDCNAIRVHNSVAVASYVMITIPQLGCNWSKKMRARAWFFFNLSAKIYVTETEKTGRTAKIYFRSLTATTQCNIDTLMLLIAFLYAIAAGFFSTFFRASVCTITIFSIACFLKWL